MSSTVRGHKLMANSQWFELRFANAPIPKPEPITVDSVRLVDLEERHCRFVCGEPEEMMFCGKDKLKGSSYCAPHHRICYRSEAKPAELRRQPLRKQPRARAA
jgi:hypothetical protein